MLNLQAADESVSRTPSTNFTVVHMKHDILRRSSVGVMATNRSQSTTVPGASNQAYGVDGNFSFFEKSDHGRLLVPKSLTEGRSYDNDSYQGRFDYAPDAWGVRLDYLKVGDNYDPEVGFTRRDNFRRSYGSARFSPRPRGSKRVRRYTTEATLEYLVNGADQLESRSRGARFDTEFQNSDTFTVDFNNSYELLIRPFTVSPGVIIPPGGYGFSDVTTTYSIRAAAASCPRATNT